MPNQLRANWELVRLTESALRHGSEGLDSLPQMVAELCRTGAWREFALPSGKTVAYEAFADFVIAKPPRGLGSSVDFLDRAISRDPEARDELDKVVQRLPHTHPDVNNINVRRPQGTNQTQALRRLRKDRPDLHARVLKGEISANWAMVEARFRPRTISVPVTRPEAVARSLLRHMSAHDIARLIVVLTTGKAPGA